MVSSADFFIAVYTNEVKDYCDEEFFANLEALKGEAEVEIVDNSESSNYFARLLKLAPYANVHHIFVAKEPKLSRFQRNVVESVNILRDSFLKGDKKYFLIIESDVIPPTNLLVRLGEVIAHISSERWGGVGALYYDGFHDFEQEGIRQSHHILSGCTVYSRELIESHSFRYDPENLSPFPDAWMSYDASHDERKYSLWNDHDIRCKHLHTKHGTRLSKPL